MKSSRVQVIRWLVLGLLLAGLIAVPATHAAPAAANTPTSKQIGSAVSGFSMAVILSKHDQARLYMTTPLRARSQQVALDRFLGIQTHPTRYTYVITPSTPVKATVRVSFQLPTAAPSIVRILGMTKTSGGWLIDSIVVPGKGMLTPDLQVPGGPQIVVGKSGDNLWPLAVRITVDGRVSGFWTADSHGGKGYPRARLSLDAVAGLMTLARAEHFFTLPARIGTGPANAATRFITIYSGTTSRTVSVRGSVATPAFDQLYAVIVAAVGVPCNPARQCGV